MTPALAAARRHLGRKSPELCAVIKRVGPCTLAPKPDEPFSLLVGCVVSQQISTLAAKSIFAKLAAAAGGDPIKPKKLAALTPEQLRACGLSGPKQRTIANVLAFHTANPKLLPNLGDVPSDEIAATLTTIPGIGPWTVDMLLIFGLGRPDVWPVGDYGVRVAAGRLFGLAETPSAKDLGPLGEPFRPYRSFAAWYLWRSLEKPSA